MLTELLGKGGKLCQQAQEGKLRCPLIVRPNAEDPITGNLMGVLKVLQPRWWLPDLLNTALGASRFDRQVFPKLAIDLWKNRPVFPRELLTWAEGSSQIDVSIAWEWVPTTVFWEFKYTSPLSPHTTNADRACVRISRIAVDAMMISSRSVPVTVWIADSISRVRS